MLHNARFIDSVRELSGQPSHVLENVSFCISTTTINVGLALSYVKLFISSWKIYMCSLKAWFINK